MKARKLVLTAALAAAALGAYGSAAHAAESDYVGGTNKERVLGNDLSRDPGRAAPGTEGTTRGGLPVTGGDVLGLAAIGAAAVGTGAVLVRRSRRTPENA